MSKIIAIANQKGGVGKTTTAINLSSSLAHLSQETLLIDLDPQANTTSGLGIDKQEVENSIYQVLLEELPLKDILLSTGLDWLDLAPSSINLVGAEIELVSVLSRETRLRKALENLDKIYKYIAIDCPPSLGLLTINALTAANSVLIPIQCEYYALEGLGQLLKTIDLIRANLNPRLEIEGVLLTMFDGRINLSQQVVEEVKKHFGPKVYNTVIPRTVRIAEAPSFGKPIILYDQHCKGAESYLSLAKEIISLKQEILQATSEPEKEPVLG